MKYIFDTSTISIDKNGFLLMKIHAQKSDKIDIQEAKRISDAIIKICDNQPRYFLVDALDVFGSITHEARDYFAKHPELEKLTIAEAYVINSIAIKLIAKFYMSYHKPPHPAKIFSDYKKAVTWLKNYQ